MGFCLFERPDLRGFYIAVNVAHVDDVVPKDRHICRLDLSAGPDAERLIEVLGQEMPIRKQLYEAAKIGLNKAEVTILGGKKGYYRPAPLLINALGRIVFARELAPEEFYQEDAEFVTASVLSLEDGTQRHIVDRAGLFARKANAGGRVPMILGDD